MVFLYFIVLVGGLIFVHELGHYVLARICGVRVLRFSLGIGPKIAGFRSGETEYVIGMVPLGGYVRMLGEGPEEGLTEDQAEHSLYGQSLFRRIAIALAGPVMNLLFPVMLFFVVCLGDTLVSPPLIGTVLPDHPADGKLFPGDRILAVDGEDVASFDDVQEIVGARIGQSVHFSIDRDGHTIDVLVMPERIAHMGAFGAQKVVGAIGIMPISEAPVIGVSGRESPAALAGLQSFDRVVAIGGKPIRRFPDLEKVLDHNHGALMPITYFRPTVVRDALSGLVSLAVYEPHVATLAPDHGAASGLSRAGIDSAETYVDEVRDGSKEADIGLHRGDRVLAIDHEPVRTWASFHERIDRDLSSEHTIEWRHENEVHSTTLRFTGHESLTSEPISQAYLRHWEPSTPVANPHQIRYALREAWRRTYEIARAMVASMLQLFGGGVSVSDLGGPLAIFDIVSIAARAGAFNYLNLMAFLSVNVGLINLLPIPLLDGGTLLYLVIETVTRRPLSARTREIASAIGFVVLVLLIVLAFANDVLRQWPLLSTNFRAS